MSARGYRLGKRQASVDETYGRILRAARDLVAAGTDPGVGAIAERAGVSRITIYNRFGSRSGLLAALGSRIHAPLAQEPAHALQPYLLQRCAEWARDPALYRNLGAVDHSDETPRLLAERLAASDQLRPGCSIKEAEDVIRVLTSFETFDRLHHDGRRSVAAVGEILMRLASGILAYHP